MIDRNQIPEEYKNHISPEKDWKEIVAWVGDLPPLPQIAAQALTLIEDPDTSAGKLTTLLSTDAALAARVLKIANSAMFFRPREITTLNQAIMTIGFKTLKGIIVAATLRQLNRKYGQIEQMIWQNSTCTALACRHLAIKLRKPYIEEIFLLGLLHDLGKLVIIRQIPGEYKKIVEYSCTGVTFVNAEQQKLGFAHTLIGALVAKKWNFSMETCQTILHHHDMTPDQMTEPCHEKTLIVQFADLISHKLGYGHEEGFPDFSEEIKTLADFFKLNENDLAQIQEGVKKTFEEMGSLLG